MTDYDKLAKKLEVATALRVAGTVMAWDTNTAHGAPPAAGPYTGRVRATLAGEYFSVMTDPQVEELAARLAKDETLTLAQKTVVRELEYQFDELRAIPKEEYTAFQGLLAVVEAEWRKAKAENDYAGFLPTFQKVVETRRRFAGLRAKNGQDPMNVLLEDFERGFTMAELDPFFAQLKQAIVPLLRRIQEKGQPAFVPIYCPVHQQRRLARFMAEYIGFDFDRGVLSTTEHPFTTSLHNHDARITTHFYPDNMERGLFSVLHEGGHGIYEQGFDDALTLTMAAGAGAALHESQSRFYENMIGRSEAFWAPVYEKLQELCPAYSVVPLADFIKRINRVEPGFIRTEADELTYCLHIMVRYELEKELMAGTLSMEELPAAWNRRYTEYLGVTPPTDTLGVLQDVHWPSGEFGYFPSYALGNAIGAQIWHHMKKTTQVEDWLRAGELYKVKDYLNEHIHRFGLTKTTPEILRDLTGEDFNPAYYVEYLTEKYTAVYDL